MTDLLITRQLPLSTLLSDEYALWVESYLRPYGWTIEQARRLFEDLLGFVRAGDHPSEAMLRYLLGSVVLMKGPMPLAVVLDGYQRLATLTIMLAAIRASLGAENAGQITAMIQEPPDALEPQKRFRVWLQNPDGAFFERYIQREGGLADLLQLEECVSDSQVSIKANARLFRDRLEELSDKEKARLAQFLVTRCDVEVIVLRDLDTACRVIPTLPGRSGEFSVVDILRIEIIGSVPAVEREAYAKKWDEAEKDLGRDAFADLFGRISMAHGKAKPDSTLLDEFRDNIRAERQPIRFVDDVLLPMVRGYRRYCSGGVASAEEIDEHLRRLGRAVFADWVSPAMSRRGET